MTLFGYTLLDLRRKRNMSLAELGKATGIGTATLANMESGYIEPDDASAKKIAKVFGVTVGYMKGIVEVVIPPSDGAAESPQRFVKLRPVSAGIFSGEETESAPARDIILPLAPSDRCEYMAVRWGDNSMTRYRIEAGDILIIRADASAVRSGDLILFTTPDRKTILRRFYREGGKIILRSDDDDLLLPLSYEAGEEGCNILGTVKEILTEVNEPFLARRGKNPPERAEELFSGAKEITENMQMYKYPEA